MHGSVHSGLNLVAVNLASDKIYGHLEHPHMASVYPLITLSALRPRNLTRLLCHLICITDKVGKPHLNDGFAPQLSSR